MNGLSISQLCCLFCCPPCPSRIAAKLAFLPPEPTYAVVPEPEPVGSTSTGSLRSGAVGGGERRQADFQYSQRELDNIEVFVTKSSRGNRVGCMYVRCVPGARAMPCVYPTSPGGITSWPSCPSVFAHRLWGCPTSPLSALRWDELLLRLSLAARPAGPKGRSPSRKLSLGAVVTTVWSSSVTPGEILSWSSSLAEAPCPRALLRNGSALIPVLTPLSHLFPTHLLGSIEKISKITSPVLIIHGTEDEVIDFSHGLALFERCPKAVEPLWVDGAGHNDIELYSQYLERLRKFISQELASQRN
ncbi:Alpha/beta hydrolase domain-containing protein 17C [Aptenodytes forsteri]|uniref:Alpha/beta hydrolase domain-containing protein 17C n=1 Tax=Aptenodytes forsteri TaxID=9233 RepID=A0A087RCW9_APTFO|nr:Alpha/beta hydrolase domain-containing protein 17C [Aptenodytes forsteri]